MKELQRFLAKICLTKMLLAMNRKISTLIIGGLLLASCAIEDVTEVVPGNGTACTVTATIGAETKTSLGENEDGIYKVLWTEGDKIAVRTSDAAAQSAYTAKEGGDVTAVFTPDKADAVLDFTKGAIAAYPAENVEIVSLDKINITIPASQTYVENTFADDVMPMVSSETEKPEFTFYNAAGALKLMVSAGSESFKVSSISVSSESGFISGKFEYDPEKKEYAAGNADAGKKISLDCGNGVTVGKDAKAFVVVVPHGEYADFAIKVASTDGREQTFNLKDGKTLKIERSSMLNIPIVADEMKEPEGRGFSIAWSYEYGAVWTNEDGLSDVQELEVSGVEDITKLKDADGNLFTPLEGGLTLKGKATDSKGEEHEATAVITSLSKKAVGLTGGNIPFGQGEVLTYNFTGKLYDDEYTEYTIRFDVKTGAMPEDKVIELGDVMVDGKFSSPMYGRIDPYTATIAEDRAYFPEYETTEGKEAILAEYYKQAGENTSTLQVILNDEEVEGAGFIIKYDETEEENVSYLSIPAGGAKYDDDLTFIYTTEIFGVKYTYTAVAKVRCLGYSIEHNALWVNPDMTVNLVGSVILPKFTKGEGTAAGKAYQLPNIDLSDFVRVNGESEDDKKYNELSLLYRVATKLYDEDDETILKEDEDFAEIQHDWTYTTYNYIDYVNLLKWNTEDDDALYRNELDVEIELVVTGHHDISYGQVDLTLVVKELMTFNAIAPDKTKKQGAYSVWDRSTGKWSAVNVASALSAFDKKTSAELYNKYAKDITEFWKGYVYDADGKTYVTRTDENVKKEETFRVYGQTDLVIDTEHITAELETSGVEISSDFYKVDPETGDVTINATGITDNLIIKVPVTFKHNFCGDDHKQIAEIKFYKD